jgi:hypothetical protein
MLGAWLIAIDLESEGMKALLKLTNEQFEYWGNELKRSTSETIKPGDLMDYWFIMATLAQHGPNFRILKKPAFEDMIPHLKGETVRRHAGLAEKFGFVETVKSKGTTYLQLTPAGQKAVANTLVSWVREFGKIQRKYFPETDDDS